MGRKISILSRKMKLAPNVLLVSEKEFLSDLKKEDRVKFSIMVKPKEEDKP